jgi:hypothetical protein
MGIFTIGIIYSDLLKMQQGLIHKYYSEQRKLVIFLYGLKNTVQMEMPRFSAKNVWIVLYKLSKVWLHAFSYNGLLRE